MVYYSLLTFFCISLYTVRDQTQSKHQIKVSIESNANSVLVSLWP